MNDIVNQPPQLVGSIEEKFGSLYNYLWKTAEQLNIVLRRIDDSGEDLVQYIGPDGTVSMVSQETYNALKSATEEAEEALSAFKEYVRTGYATNATAAGLMPISTYDAEGGRRQVAFKDQLSSYVPKTGGTMTGSLTASSDGTSARSFTATNDTGSVSLIAGSTYRGVFDNTTSKYLIRANTGASGGTGSVVPDDLAVLKDLNVTGSISASNIGDCKTVSSTTAVSVPTGAYKTISTISLTKGVWVIVGQVQYASQGAYANAVTINNTQDSYNLSCVDIRYYSNYINVSHIVSISSDSSYYLNVRQNSGADMNVTPRSFRAVQIS